MENFRARENGEKMVERRGNAAPTAVEVLNVYKP